MFNGIRNYYEKSVSVYGTIKLRNVSREYKNEYKR